MLQDGTQAARTGLARQRLLGDGVHGGRADFQLGAFHLQQLGVLLDQGVLGLDQDLDQGVLIQLVQGGDHRQATDQFRDQAELDQVFRLGIEQDFRIGLLGLALDAGREADAALLGTIRDDLGQAIECAAADEHDVGRVDLHEILVRMLAATLRRYRGHGALDKLEQGLLHAFAGHVAGNRRVIRLARNLVDFVDVDDALLGFLDFVIAVLQQLLDDVLDVLADIAGFGQRGRIGDHEGNVEHACQGLRQQRLAGARRADQQDVALGQFDIVLLAQVFQALVVVVHRHRQDTLGSDLPDHVLIQQVADFLGGRQIRLGASYRIDAGSLITDDVVAQVDTFVADEDRRTGNQLLDFMLALAAEGAVKQFFAAGRFFLRHRATRIEVTPRSYPRNPDPSRLGHVHCPKMLHETAPCSLYVSASVIYQANRAEKAALYRFHQKSAKKNARTMFRSGICFASCDAALNSGSSAFGQHLIDQAIFRGGLGRHEIVAIGILADLIDRAAGLFSEDGVETFTQVQDFTRLDLDIRCLALGAAQRLVNHDARVRQREALALGAGGQQESPHGRGQARAQGRHLRLDELHGVEDRHAGRNRTARRIDVQGNVLVRIFAFQEQQLGDDQVGHRIIDRSNQENDAFLQQARIDIVGALAATTLLDHHRHHAEHLGVQCRLLDQTCHVCILKRKSFPILLEKTGLRLCLITHQFVERNRLFRDLGLAENVVDDVFFQNKGFDFGQAATVGEVVLQHLLRVFVALGEIFDLGLDLFFGGFQLVLLDHFSQDQTQAHAALGLGGEQFLGQLHALGVHAALCHVLACHFGQALDVLLDQGLGDFQVGCLDQGIHDAVLGLGLGAGGDFALQVLLDVFAHLGQIAVFDAQGLSEDCIDFRHVRPFDLRDGDGELGGLAGHILAVVILGESQREGLGLAHLQADGRSFEFRQHAAFAQYEREGFSLATLEFHAIDLADEVDGHAVAVLGRLVGTAVAVRALLALDVVVHALLAQDVDGLVDFSVGDRGDGLLDVGTGELAHGDFRIDFEGRVEGQLTFTGFFAGLGFDAGEACHAQVVLDGGVIECAADLVVQDFGFDLVAELGGNHLHRHFTRTETRRLGGTGAHLQALFHFSLNIGQRESQGHTTFEFAQGFDCSCHLNRPNVKNSVSRSIFPASQSDLIDGLQTSSALPGRAKARYSIRKKRRQSKIGLAALQTSANARRRPPSQDWRGLQGILPDPLIARQQKQTEKNLVDFIHLTGIGVAADIGTAVTAFIGLPSMSLSEYVRQTRVLRLVSTTRTTCRRLKRMDMRSLKTSSWTGSFSLNCTVGATWRQAMEASDLSSARPTVPLTPPVRARETQQVTPSTLGSSQASMTTRSFLPSQRKAVLTSARSSAAAACGKMAATVQVANIAPARARAVWIMGYLFRDWIGTNDDVPTYWMGPGAWHRVVRYRAPPHPSTQLSSTLDECPLRQRTPPPPSMTVTGLGHPVGTARLAAQHQGHDGGQRQRCRDHVQAGRIAACRVLEPTDGKRPHETAQVAQRVDHRNAGSCARTGEEGAGHGPQRRLGRTDPDVHDDQRQHHEQRSRGIARQQEADACQHARQDHVPGTLTGTVRMTGPQHHGDHGHDAGHPCQQTGLERAEAEFADHQGRPQTQGVKASGGTKIDQRQGQDARVLECAPGAGRMPVTALLGIGLDLQACDQPLALILLQPFGLLRPIGHVLQHHEAQDDGRCCLDDVEHLPVCESKDARQLHDGARQGRAQCNGNRGGGHEPGCRDRSLLGREPQRQVQDDAREEARLRHAQHEAQDIEAVRTDGKGRNGRDQPPGHHHPRNPDARADLVQDQVGRHFKQEVADEEQPSAQAESGRRQAQLLVHRDGGEAHIDTIKKADEIKQHHEWNDAPHEFAGNACFDIGCHCLLLRAQVRLQNGVVVPSERLQGGRGLLFWSGTAV
eukprot:TRINITY_DN2018_c0_g1_i2.p1 TRINITY_DN2018_c0_g1~~TRINITY_DN2018_c0_g1_i2.p1  ORF type:complete len:1935 (-),score=514.39 TRINITY_DN2018_c0_g1_i2:42295-48099(-)